MLFLEQVRDMYPDLTNIFEVGAHRGYDIPELLTTWPNATIFAFEADPFNYQIVSEKFKNVPRVHIYHLAVTDETKKMTFNRYHDVESIPSSETMVGQNLQNTGQGSLLKPGKGMKEIFRTKNIVQQLQVDGTTLYDFCLSHNVPSIDAIFMDVQGCEYNVLVGCRDLLKTVKATIFEWSTDYIMYDGETDFNIIKPYLEGHGFEEIDREYQFKGISGDSLFLRTGLSV